MKVAHVLPSLARGGGERLTIELANRQVDAGHDVTLIIGSSLPADQVHQGLDPGVSARYVSASAGRGRYAAMLPWIWRNRRWLASQDVLHCHLTYGSLFAAAFGTLRRRRRRPVIVETYHAVGMPIPPLQRRVHAGLASRWDGLTFMVEDPYWREVMKGHPRVLSRVIPVGVDAPPVDRISTAGREAYRAKLGIPSEALVVTSIGRLVVERRPRAYIPAFVKIASVLDRDVRFVLGGDGPEREPIEADARAAGILDRLHLPGLVTEIELPLAISDLYVTASVGPVPGVAGLQAIAAGIPTIALQLRPDYLPSAADWIWSSRDPDEIAEKAVELLRDPAAARALARAQRDHLEKHHSATAMAASYDRFYWDVMASRDVRP